MHLLWSSSVTRLLLSLRGSVIIGKIGPLVTEFVISGADPAADLPELRVTWLITGRQRIEPALGPGDAEPWDWADGEGEWWPSLGWLDMIRLLGPPPAGDAG
jgi:hypothetical protein